MLLTILFPGAGHLYIGNSSKATPFLIANAIGFILALTLVGLPIAFIIWVVTLVMTAPQMSKETDEYNKRIP